MAVLAGAMLITGAAGEIGGHLAAHFLRAGRTVVGLDKVVATAVPGLVIERCDLTDAAAATRAVEGLVARHGPFEVVVNCAARIASEPLVRLGPDGWRGHDQALWDDVLAAGLTATFTVTRAAVLALLRAKRPGLVVNFSSIAARGNSGQVAYAAAKAGVEGLTRTLAKELGPLGIRVVAIAPGFLDTRSTRAHVPEKRLLQLTGAVPLRRLGAVEDVAGAVEFAIANEYLTGTVIELDGGLVV